MSWLAFESFLNGEIRVLGQNMTKCHNRKIMSKKVLHFLAHSKPSTILFSALLLITGVIGALERIGVAAAVDTTTTDLTLEQERRLVDEGYKTVSYTHLTLPTSDLV